jgi:hypothetical protein
MSLYSDIEEKKTLDVKDGSGRTICEIFKCKKHQCHYDCSECLVKILYRHTLDPDGAIQIKLRSRPTNYEGDKLP